MARGAAARARSTSTTSSRSATARRSTRTPTSSTSSTRCARSRRRRGRSACSATRTTRSTFELADDGFDSVGSADARRRCRCTLKPGSKYLINPARSASRATAIRAPPTPSSTRTARAWSCSGCDYADRRRAGRRSMKAGLPEVLAQRLASAVTGRSRDVTRARCSNSASTFASLLRLLAPLFSFSSRIGVPRRARAENPADHDADQQHRRDEDEVPGCHRPRSAASGAASARISSSTLSEPPPDRPQVEHHQRPDERVGARSGAAPPAAARPAAASRPARTRSVAGGGCSAQGRRAPSSTNEVSSDRRDVAGSSSFLVREIQLVERGAWRFRG